MGAVPVVKIKKNYHAVSHHHRIEALKQEFGKEYEVEVVVHDYTGEQMLRGMAVENLTQRSGDDVKEVVENLVMIRNFLIKNVAGRSPTNQNSRKQNQPEVGSVSHIYEWLNQTGEVMSLTSIKEHLAIHDNLDDELYNAIHKTHSGEAEKRTDGKTISKSQAIVLARFKDHKEQKDLAKNLLKSRADRVRDQSRLLSKYKDLKKDEITLQRKADEKNNLVNNGWTVTKEDKGIIEVKREKTEDEKAQHENVIQSIRAGKMDIADVNIGIDLPTLPKTSLDAEIEIMDAFIKLKNDINKNKPFLEKMSAFKLIKIYTYVGAMMKEDLKPFLEELIAEIIEKDGGKVLDRINGEEEVVFEIKYFKGGKTK